MNVDVFVYTDRFAHEAHIYWDRHWKKIPVVGGRTDLLSAEVMKDKTD